MLSNKIAKTPTDRLLKGFTLIEVLVAMTMLAVGILGVMGAFTLAMQTASRSGRLGEVAAVAEQQLELAVTTRPGEAEPKTGSAGPYAWTVTFSDRPHALMLASVTVSWSDHGQPQTFQLSRVFLPRR